MLKAYSNGITLGIPPSPSDHQRGLKQKTSGWSASSTRNNTKFLYSIDTTKLQGQGIAFTFTVRDLPKTPRQWALIRQSFFERIKRRQGSNFLRFHWVTEWQRRGVPHLHGCMYFARDLSVSDYLELPKLWCQCANNHSYATQKGQFVTLIDGAVGWLKYLAKHNSRSAYHYQRASKPSQWDSSGRVWGKGGEWPERVTEHDISDYYHQFRRLVKRWRIADARSEQNNYRITSARKCLKCNDRSLSSVRGLSEWIPEKLAMDMVRWFEQNAEGI